eukprot:TRINITY_DN8511_c0_g1_i4.p1 TRINITY_DN8511_c0_g1~~TRINITY_DN8511_c0_g1_i4.p1  ORF type:complete len:146 (+),score=55.34 TRINITY_DN8511_c0_g1_i4:147-584(+)
MLRSLVGSEMCIRDRYQRRVRGIPLSSSMSTTDNLIQLTQKYFEVWNAHDQEGIQGLHAEESSLQDWSCQLGPTNADVATGIAGIWSGAPKIAINVLDIYLCQPTLTCVANIEVVVDENTTIKVCDVIAYNDEGKVVSLNAYLKA